MAGVMAKAADLHVADALLSIIASASHRVRKSLCLWTSVHDMQQKRRALLASLSGRLQTVLRIRKVQLTIFSRARNGSLSTVRRKNLA